MTEDLLYRNQFPSFIVICKNVEDIQKSVLFASFHNIQISILSTGHSYSGRCTANFSVQINLSQMRNYKINKNSNNKIESITVETGLQMGSIYGLVAPNILIGPNDPSVGPGGSSLRGGHSPVGPHYGLMSDFTLEYFIVNANADIIHVYNTSGLNKTIDDLFWSLKGGGGSTFGVVVNITFKVHPPEERAVFTSLTCNYPFYTFNGQFIGDYIFNNFWKIVQTELDEEWSGYILTGSNSYDKHSFVIDINFYGNSSYAMSNADPLLHLSEPYVNNTCQDFKIYPTFEQFQVQWTPDTGGYYDQWWNDLIPAENLTAEYTNTLFGFFNASKLNDGFSSGMLGIFQGGKINSFPDNYTAVTAGFRHNKFEIGMGIVWSDEKYTNNAMKRANEWESKFTKFGIGKYSNEENYECGNGCNWKQLFYGQIHYDKLLKVKQKWDPNQVFWCNHCVGSDL
eukprot:287919_1